MVKECALLSGRLGWNLPFASKEKVGNRADKTDKQCGRPAPLTANNPARWSSTNVHERRDQERHLDNPGDYNRPALGSGKILPSFLLHLQTPISDRVREVGSSAGTAKDTRLW